MPVTDTTPPRIDAARRSIDHARGLCACAMNQVEYPDLRSSAMDQLRLASAAIASAVGKINAEQEGGAL